MSSPSFFSSAVMLASLVAISAISPSFVAAASATSVLEVGEGVVVARRQACVALPC